MNVLFTCNHPAHYLNVINAAKILQQNGHRVAFTSRNKDLLLTLVEQSGFTNYVLNSKPRKGKGKISLYKEVLTRLWHLVLVIHKFKPDIMFGSDIVHAQAGFLLHKPAILNNEDDAAAVPYTDKYGMRFAKYVLAPHCCQADNWGNKIGFTGYQKLAYLHPRYFLPNKSIVEAVIPMDKPFYLLRFSSLQAHHDKNVRGINNELAKKIIELLEPHGRVYISAERSLNPELEKYHLNIGPKFVHHFLYYADLFIGDSQTMVAESALLGTPAVRFNDFVGRLSYLTEIETRFNLSYGIHPDHESDLLPTISSLIDQKDLKKSWREKRRQMLYQVADYTAMIVWLITEYPSSAVMMRKQRNYADRFIPAKAEIDELLAREIW